MPAEPANAGDDRIYHGFCDDAEGECQVVVIMPGAVIGHPLPLRLDLANKSPTGFAWGYNGSGPAQLALALCADALADDEAALSLFQDFKARVVGRLDQDAPWTLSAGEVRRHCREMEAERMARQGEA